jgi:hypothetical protein
MDKSFHYDLVCGGNQCVGSFTRNVLFNPPIPKSLTYLYKKWNIKWKTYESDDRVDFFSLRQDSYDMAPHADIIFHGDDDLEFQVGSTAAINQCCFYMANHPDCGAIYLGGNFGGEGDRHETDIYIDNKGHLGTNRGILIRNRKNILDNRLHALGCNADFLVGFTALLQGYYVARRLHVPIEHHTTKILSEDHPDPNYDLKIIKQRGIMDKVNTVIGKWEDHSVWPENIFKEYKQNAMRKGFAPKYDSYGNIEYGE